MMENENLKKTGAKQRWTKIKLNAKNNLRILGYNLAVFTVYTLGLNFTNSGFIVEAYFIFGHVINCIICSIHFRSWAWLLSALLIIGIGLSTCTFTIPVRHQD